MSGHMPFINDSEKISIPIDAALETKELRSRWSRMIFILVSTVCGKLFTMNGTFQRFHNSGFNDYWPIKKEKWSSVLRTLCLHWSKLKRLFWLTGNYGWISAISMLSRAHCGEGWRHSHSIQVLFCRFMNLNN